MNRRMKNVWKYDSAVKAVFHAEQMCGRCVSGRIQERCRRGVMAGRRCKVLGREKKSEGQRYGL